ncbi:2'-5'-oligoadenylate synthase-like protein 2 [Amphiura filiformis]|uniref:2'-5'-oligoadenylate synthase-like protein 2 n=1 Tax=Amphiura filiformis TaxID=82378 RepID=UPI003B2170E5
MKKRLIAPYNAMMKMNDKAQRFIYQPCLTPLQTEFVKSQPTNVKSLIRLVKYWKAEYLQRRQTEKLINSYTLELITIYVYKDEMDSPDKFDLAEGFKRVLSLLAARLDGFQHFWDTYYSKDVAQRNITRLKLGRSQYFTKIPVLLDPADPTDNVFERWMDGLHKVSKFARKHWRLLSWKILWYRQ